MSKYKPLENYLKNLNKHEVKLTYKDIDDIIEGELPPTAYKLNEWWSNNTNGHTQALAWVNAGWIVKQAKLKDYVIFAKAK